MILTHEVAHSFESGETGALKVYFPSAVKVLRARVQVTKNLSGGDVGTITLRNSAAEPLGDGAVTLEVSAGFSKEAAINLGFGYDVSAGDFIVVETAKRTPGGEVRVAIEYSLTP